MTKRVRLRPFFILCSAALIAYAFGHLYIFGAALNEQTWEHVFGFTRIIIPDTYHYIIAADAENLAEFLVLTTIKNSIGPGLVWLIFQKNWYLVSTFNAICFYFVLIYTEKLIVLLNPTQRRKCYSAGAILTIVCMYYSVGSLKEIPTLLGFTAFVYHFLVKQKTKALFWFLILTFFRFQFGLLIFPVYLFSKLRKNPFSLTLISIVVLGVLFPLFSIFNVFSTDAIGLYREDSGQAQNSVGTLVEFARGNIFGVSLLAILIRVVQSILEPLIYFLSTFSFLEDGSISLYQAHAALVLLIMFRIWTSVLFEKRFWKTRGANGRDTKFGILYSFLILSIFTIAGTGLVSHRFLVPIYAILLVAAYAVPERQGRLLINRNSVLATA